MKKLITEYTFDPVTKQITLPQAYALSQLLLVTNTTSNTIIYNFANPALGGSMSGKILTLNVNTAGMSSTDALQIFVDDASVPATEDTQGTMAGLLQRILGMLTAPVGYDKAQARSRVTAVVESGTVTTVSNVSQIDAIPARPLVLGINTTAWTLSVRERIS
jgi:hypothetical protein